MREQRTISLRQSADSIDDSRIFLLFLSCSTGDHNPAACASSRGKLRGTVIRSAQPEIDIPDARHYAPVQMYLPSIRTAFRSNQVLFNFTLLESTLA